MKQIATILYIIGIGLTAQAQEAPQARMEWTADGRLDLAWTQRLDERLPREYSLWLTPMLCNGEDTLRFAPEVIRGKLNRKRWERALRLSGTPEEELPALRTSETAPAYDTDSRTISWRRTVSPEPWMKRGAVDFCVEAEKEGCCDVTPLPTQKLGRTAYVPPFVPWLTLVPEGGVASELAKRYPVLHHVSEYEPYDPEKPVSKARGALYVHFPMDVHEVLRDFRNNRQRLDSLVQLTAAIAIDTVSHVSCIQIIGMASPDGPRRRNERLAGRRVQALKDYLQQRVDIPDSIFEVINGGEAWTELRQQIAESDAPYRQEMLDIIDHTEDPDRREYLLKTLERGRAYDYLRKNVLQDQRYSGYLRVYYDVKPDTVPPVVNRAIALIREGRNEEALRTVRTVAFDPRSWNTLGCALYLNGRAEEAARYLGQATARGDHDAPKNTEQMDFIAAQRALLAEEYGAENVKERE